MAPPCCPLRKAILNRPFARNSLLSVEVVAVRVKWRLIGNDVYNPEGALLEKPVLVPWELDVTEDDHQQKLFQRKRITTVRFRCPVLLGAMDELRVSGVVVTELMVTSTFSKILRSCLSWVATFTEIIGQRLVSATMYRGVFEELSAPVYDWKESTRCCPAS